MNTASASDGTTTSEDAKVTVSATQTPALDIVKTANETVFAIAGDILSYDYLVTNTGNVTITNAISVADDKIPNVICPALPVDGLIPTGSITCTGTYAVTQADVDSGSVVNIASATDGTITTPDVSETVNGDQTPALSLTKTALTTEFENVGDQIDYEYVVTNAGNVTITNAISVTDDQIAVVSCPALPSGGLTPGESLTCTATDIITQADIDAGTLTNTASATDGNVTSPDATETVGGNQTNAFTLDKVAQSTDFTAVGDVLSYDYIVLNTGNVTMTNPITIVDDVIGNITCPALPAGGLIPGNNITCSATYAVTQADIDAGQVTNVAVAQSGDQQSAPDTVIITGTQAPQLDIDKSTPTVDFNAVGEIITYSYVVSNLGNTTIVNPITVSDDKIANVICPALPVGGLVPTASLTCSGDYAVTQADLDTGEVTNIATASAGTTTSASDSVTVDAVQSSGLAFDKIALTTEFNQPGDILGYEYVVTNTGNTTIIDSVSVADDKIASVICPSLPVGGLVPTASIICSGEYTVTQADIDAGSVTNIASASAGDLTSLTDDVTINANNAPELTITKAATESVQAFGPLHDVTYVINVENTGNVTLNNFQVSDDLQTALAPSTLFTTPIVSVSGINGATANTAYDGINNIDLLSGSPVLNVGDSGVITITTRIDTINGGPAQPNTASASSTELGITPSNPASIIIEDLDGDGSPDNLESCTQDRDGDGIPDCEDYDPTGYFYCEENGAILSGGGISVTGPAGSNSSIGFANNINIIQDGSDGFFQFYVTAAGRYVLTPTYPTSGVPSVTRLAQNTALDVTSLLPQNPAIIGSSEFGNTGQISDFSANANTPFYFEFDIEAGDPSVLMNNIPVSYTHLTLPTIYSV